MPPGAEKLLNEKEMAMVNRTEQIRDIVKSEVWQAEDAALAEDFLTAKVQVFNFFTLKAGQTRAAHQKIESEIWKPVHQARVDAGTMKGWISLSMVLPYGTEQVYQDATVDIYADMKQFMSPYKIPEFFSKVHVGKDAEAMMNKVSDVAELMRGEVRIMLDYVE